MRLIKVGLGNVNTTVGKVAENTDKIIQQAEMMADSLVTIGVFPEQVIGGYPPEDLVQWPAFVESQSRELLRFAKLTRELLSVFAVGLVVRKGDLLYNCAALVHRGIVLGVCPKEKLPLYNVFYESRTLARGIPGQASTVRLPGLGCDIPFGDIIYAFDFGIVALEVCEDIWSPDGPMRRRCYSGAEIVLNLSASPFRVGVVSTRREMLATRSSDNQATLVYVNAVGANDGLVFDGGGYVFQNGRLLLEAPRFKQGVSTVVLDLDRTKRIRTENTTWRNDCTAFQAQSQPVAVETLSRDVHSRRHLRYPVPSNRSFFIPETATVRSAREEFCEDLLDAMAMGIGDYFEKTGAFRTIGVSLSGGRDSLLSLLVAHRHLTKHLDPICKRRVAGERLRAFYMPTHFSSSGTQQAAEKVAEELGVPFVVLSIEEAFAREIEAAKKMLQPGESLPPVALQNIQARLRAQRMWNWSNGAGGLFLQTGNMSEKAVGYTTVGGDLMGALAPIANLPKTVVIHLLNYLLDVMGLTGIRDTLTIPASAELAPEQEDEKDLMPFPVLDACIHLYVGEKMSSEDMKLILVQMFQEHQNQINDWVDKFVRLFHQNIFKWVQSPLSLHLGALDLERERALQLPVVSRL